MLVLDLEKLNIHKEYSVVTVNRSVEVNLFEATSITTYKNRFNDLCKEMIQHQAIPVEYRIEFTTPKEGVASDAEIDALLSVINIFTMCFFKNMTLTEGRKRERRLDVPDKLTAAKISRSLLKNAVNHKTVNDVFALIIKYKDVEYRLCDEVYAAEDKEFQHSLEELEDKHE